jgi:nitric oxide reductase subunit B
MGTRRIAYAFFSQTVILLVLYSVVSLLVAAKFIGFDPSSLPYHQVNALANVLLQLSVVGGLLGGGLYVTASQQADHRLPDERLLVWIVRLWTVLVVLAIASGVLGLLESRHLLELPLVLDILHLIIVSLTMFVVARAPNRTSITVVWLMGMGISVICLLLGALSPPDYLQDHVLRVLCAGGTWNIAYMLAGVALGYWLIHRFSDVPQVWVYTSLLTVSGFLALGGTVVTFAPFIILNPQIGWSGIAAIAACVFYLIFAAHSYKPLSARNATHTLAANWYALAVILVLLGFAVMGTAHILSIRWSAGTQINHAQHSLSAFVIVALVLGTINQAVAEMRGHNWRITGLMPFWLIAFGVIGGGLILSAAGLVQIYLERILSVGYLETQTLLTPLYVVWVIFNAATCLGLIIYALGFRARRMFVEK